MDGSEHGNGVVAEREWTELEASPLPPDLGRLATIVSTLDAMDDDERTRALALVNARFKRPATPARGRRRT